MNLRDLVPATAALEPQSISLDVLREKYCKGRAMTPSRCRSLMAWSKPNPRT